MRTNNHYEHKLVNIGEEADNTINNLKERNKVLQAIVDSKENTPEDFEQEKKVYQFRVDTVEKHNKKLREDLARGFELSLKDQDTIDELKKELKDVRNANLNLEKVNSAYRQESVDLKNDNSRNFHRSRLAYLEKLVNEHRYVFSDIPNNEENLKMVKLMKKHINSNRYTLRWRGQYLIGGEDWRKYQDGQPMNKSKCIRVYIDNKGSTDTTEGFNIQEVDLILDGLYYREDKCHSFIDNWDYKGNEKDEDVVSEKATLEQTLSLIKYFESMKVHLEECQSNMAETNNVT
tara:strand:+ start:513 stop:1382 length:870 start_codon:yes stop_codon:yes gene_type:complete